MSTRIKVEIWFDVAVEQEDAAYVINSMLTDQQDNSWDYVLPPIYDWIVCEPKDEEE
jgi:hypothetical protein